MSAARSPRFGLGLPTSGPFSQPGAILGLAERAERLGFHDVWVNDHVQITPELARLSPLGSVEAWRGGPPLFFYSLAAAGVLLGRLRPTGVAIGGLVLPLHDPRMLAKQVSSLHELGGRRLTIAVAIGSRRDEFELMQVPFARRGRIMDEYLAALDVL